MFNPPNYIVPQKSYTQEELEAAVLKATLEEREACAKVCEETIKRNSEAQFSFEIIEPAAAIRARGENK